MKIFKHNANIHVSHYVGLTGIGGVQNNFVEYLNHVAKSNTRIKHKVYTLGQVDSQYKLPVSVLNIKNPRNFIALVLDIISKKHIVHFYNNLTSLKVALLLFMIPTKKTIFHERGAIWNVSSGHRRIIQFIAWKSSTILSNSHATKTMLVNKFLVPDKKIKVIHNGINILLECKRKKSSRKISSKFRVGYIGRFESPKGVHILIDAMSYLVSENIDLILAGEGTLESDLKFNARPIKNIFFIGRVEDPYNFISGLDLLVVPSIREPLGNVCLEAGLCKVPVLAANIDGIPEIIESGVSGELIDPTIKILINLPKNSIPFPGAVVNPITREIYTPKQIDPSLLARKILNLSYDHDKLKGYSDKLHDKVVTYFNMDRYEKELHAIYDDLNV